MKLQYLDRYKEKVSLCVKCGGCQAVCPTFEATGDESMSARGRMALVEAVIDGRLEPGEGFSKRINSCLDCKGCISSCPSGVPVDEIIYAARAEIASQKGCTPFPGSLPVVLFTNNRLQRFSMRVMGLIKKLLYDPLPDLFPLPRQLRTGGRKRLLPDIGGRPLTSSHGGVHSAGERRGRVAFYVGCATNSIHQHIGKAVIEVLNQNGIEVVILKDEHCCGIPLLSKGERAAAEKVAVKNIELFTSEEVDAVVTCCATCGSTLKGYPGWIAGEKAKQFASLVTDIHTYLSRHADYRRGTGTVNAKVTWHDPCHLSRGQGIKDEPREILASIPGMEFREMEKPCRCCGFGGEASVTNYGMSIAIAEEKVRSISDSGAGDVVTGCPACKIHMEDAMNHYGVKKRVMHTVEYLAESYRAGRK